jgi:hypothetical protein
MPWSPIPKFPEIISKLKLAGFGKQVNFEVLRVFVMREVGLIRDESIRNTIKAMQDLGYIRPKGVVWEVCNMHPYDFPSDEENIDKLIGGS